MSTTLVENAANADFTTGLLAPTDGDDFTASCDLLTGNTLQGVADRTQSLNRIAGMAGGNTVTGQVNISGASMFGGTNFAVAFVGSPPAFGVIWTQNSIASAGSIGFGVQLPQGALIKRVTARIGNIGAAHGSLPTIMPTMRLVRMKDGAASTISSITDSSANVTTYDTIHSLGASPNATVLDGNYYAVLTGETGGGAAANKLTLYEISYLLGPA